MGGLWVRMGGLKDPSRKKNDAVFPKKEGPERPSSKPRRPVGRKNRNSRTHGK